MSSWRYQAVDASGRASVGVVEASTEVAARGMVRDLGLLPMQVRAQTRPGGKATGLSIPGLGNRVSARSLVAATRQLSTMIGSDYARPKVRLGTKP